MELTEIYINERVCCTDILIEHNIEFVIYYYENQGYEGLGIAFLKKRDKWLYLDISHCSCYYPFERFEDAIIFKDIRTLRDYAHSEDWSNEFTEKINTMYEICIEQFGDDLEYDVF